MPGKLALWSMTVDAPVSPVMDEKGLVEFLVEHQQRIEADPRHAAPGRSASLGPQNGKYYSRDRKDKSGERSCAGSRTSRMHHAILAMW